MSFVRAYLRASTDDQDARRATAALEDFATERQLSIAATYVENQSGASLSRPELFRLLSDCKPGDILLVEQVDRLSRLNGEDWQRLKTIIGAKRVRVVALDLPTSWSMATSDVSDFQARMFEAINAMMLDMLAAVARKDYEDRRRRQSEGISKARSAGAYRGRREDAERNGAIMELLRKGASWQTVMKSTGAARGTVAKLAKRLNNGALHEPGSGNK
jgi:DNA invertase Pin-like site-specific DNA recombinase